MRKNNKLKFEDSSLKFQIAGLGNRSSTLKEVENFIF